MTIRSIGRIGMGRLLAITMAMLMIAAVACTAATDSSSAPANNDATIAPATGANGGDGSGSGQQGSGSGSGNGSTAGSEPVLPVETTDPAVEQATGALFLEMTSPDTDELFVTQSSFEFSGRTTVDALLSVNDNVLDIDEEGRFAIKMDLEEGPNVIEVIASNGLGEQFDEVLLVIYEPA